MMTTTTTTMRWSIPNRMFSHRRHEKAVARGSWKAPRPMVILTTFLLAMPLPIRPLLQGGLGSDDEMRLIDNLFVRQGYNPLIRPVQNLNESLIVAFNMALIQLITVDEKNQILLTNVWLRMTWHDYQLEWDPYEYGGITVIRIGAEEVWKPDVVLFNNADGRYEVSYKSNVVLSYTGEILWIPPAIYKSSCTIDVEYFPFDEQECEMKFGSWTFNGDQVRLDWYDGKQKIDLSDYVQSGTWDVMSCPGNLTLEFDSQEGHNKSYITYKIKIRRKTLFYTTNLIVPCILISFLSICVFFLPADALEKMTLCISILLALVVFLLLVLKILPPTSQTVPLIAKYLLFTFIMNFMTIFITVVIINWNFRTPRTHKMPPWVRSVFLNYLPRVIFMKRPNHDGRFSEKAYSKRHHASQKESKNGSAFQSSKQNDDFHQAHDESRWRRSPLASRSSILHDPSQTESDMSNRKSQKHLRPISVSSINGIPICQETGKALEAVKYVAAHLKNENDYSEVLDDWRYIALVIDRLLLFIFFAVTICGTIGILINAPHIFEFVDQDATIRNIMANKFGLGNEEEQQQ